MTAALFSIGLAVLTLAGLAIAGVVDWFKTCPRRVETMADSLDGWS